MKKCLRPFSPFRLFKKGSCQLLAKKWALSSLIFGPNSLFLLLNIYETENVLFRSLPPCPTKIFCQFDDMYILHNIYIYIYAIAMIGQGWERRPIAQNANIAKQNIRCTVHDSIKQLLSMGVL